MSRLAQTAGLTLVAAVALHGCRITRGPACDVEAPCPVTAYCSDGTCEPMPRVVGDANLTLRINPPATHPDLVPQQISGLEVAFGSLLPDFVMLPPPTIFGDVLQQSGDETRALPSRVTLQQTDCMARACAWYQINTSRRVEQAMVPGVYDISVAPLGANVPTYTYRDRLIVEGTRVDLTIDTALTTVRGLVAREDPCAPGELTPVPGVSVHAVAEDIDGAEVRSISGLSNTDGEFYVRIPASASNVRFETWPASVDQIDESEFTVDTLPMRSIPSFVFPSVEVVEPRSDWVPTLHLGRWPTPHPVTVRVATPQGVPVPGAAIAVNAVLDFEFVTGPDVIGAVSASYGETRLLASRHEAAVSWLPGRYRVTSAGHRESGFYTGVSDAFEITLEADCSTTSPSSLLVVPTAAPEVRQGIVVDADRVVVPDAQISLVAETVQGVPRTSYGLTPSLMGLTTTSAADGRLTLPMPDGVYTALVTPPRDRMLGPSLVELEVGSSEVEFVLSEPGQIGGRILYAADDGRHLPVVRAEVEAYVERDGRPHLVATAHTDATGSYRLWLPSAE